MNPARDLARLETRLAQASAVAEWPDERLYLRVETVSGWSPAQHLDHVVKTLDLIEDRIEVLARGEGDEILQAGQPALLARLMLRLRWIPRGRGSAPTAVVPDPRPVRHRLRESLRAVTDRTGALGEQAARLREVPGLLRHPLLGPFDARLWLRFADVHTKHHLAIVADIDRRRAVGVPSPSLGPSEEPEYGMGTEAP